MYTIACQFKQIGINVCPTTVGRLLKAEGTLSFSRISKSAAAMVSVVLCSDACIAREMVDGRPYPSQRNLYDNLKDSRSNNRHCQLVVSHY